MYPAAYKTTLFPNEPMKRCTKGSLLGSNYSAHLCALWVTRCTKFSLIFRACQNCERKHARWPCHNEVPQKNNGRFHPTWRMLRPTVAIALTFCKCAASRIARKDHNTAAFRGTKTAAVLKVDEDAQQKRFSRNRRDAPQTLTNDRRK